MVYPPAEGHPSRHQPSSARPGVELATCWLQVRRPNHYTTKTTLLLLLLRLGLRSSNTAKYVKHTTRTKLDERAFSYMLVQRLGVLSLPVYTTLQTPVNFLKNHLKLSCSNEHSLLPNCFTVSLLLWYCFYVVLYFTLLSAPRQRCRAALSIL